MHLKKLLLGVNTKRDIDHLLDQEPAESSREREPVIELGRNKTEHDTSSLQASPLSSPALTELIQRMRLLGTDSCSEGQGLIDSNTLWADSAFTKSYERIFHGHSSTHVLSRDAAAFRQEHSIGDLKNSSSIGTAWSLPESWRTDRAITQHHEHTLSDRMMEHLLGELPPVDLMPVLLDAYFDNTFFPVIHRPLFVKQLGEGVHRREPSFLRLVFLVCANGARWCDDPRVLDERWPVPLSAGHRWFRQLDLWPRSILSLSRLTLWDAQSTALTALYLCGSSATYGTWHVVGTGIRMMQDIGSHRMQSPQTLETELHKRCFCSDLDNVSEIDDDLWSLEPGASPPAQPYSTSPKLSIFNQAIGLIRLYGRCLQTVYTPNRTKRMIGLGGPQGSSWAFNDINIRLKEWVRGLPSHLQLPHAQHYNNSSFFASLITLWAIYYELVVSANRSFITMSSSVALPALKICREAAREFASMAVAYSNTPGSRLVIGMTHPAFSSAMILIMDLIAGTGSIQCDELIQSVREGTYSRQQKEDDLRTCIKVLEQGESRFYMSGRLRDVVSDFEMILRLHSTPAYATAPKSHTDTSRVDSSTTITFDIDGPPDITPVTDNPQQPRAL
ncbi:Fungal specific transcription factor domain [Rhizoctonia solani]|uniref:Fungal specific transcription factor domain n=1 Tax=Rhizoctonia solani TaxID=456999 RepID=A0A8H7M6L3_9AGAM|nr:Fungal specific transcription factor domain [Rhizoctonia solani]